MGKLRLESARKPNRNFTDNNTANIPMMLRLSRRMFPCWILIVICCWIDVAASSVAESTTGSSSISSVDERSENPESHCSTTTMEEQTECIATDFGSKKNKAANKYENKDHDEEYEALQELLSRIHTHEFFINGTWVSPSSSSSPKNNSGREEKEEENQVLPLQDPSTGQFFAEIALGSAADVDLAVQAAQEALPHWKLPTMKRQRRECVQRLLRLYRQYQDEFALLISREMGSPYDMARSSQFGAGLSHIVETLQVFSSFEFVRTLPNMADEYDTVQQAQTTILMDPVGVVAAITPWNWPLNQITIKIIPALLVGCTVVLKPSEITPLSALLFAELMQRADFPPGVFNLVNGRGEVVGHQLASHPLVDMVSLTGSNRAGAAVSHAAADTFKKVSLELGGKGANIVFEDVGGEWADEILASATGDFYNSGQSCNYGSRLLVQSSLLPAAVEATRQSALQTRVDSAHKRGDDFIGPVSSMAQYDRIQRLIQSGIDQGATLVAGGLGRPPNVPEGGAYVRPTVFVNCTAKMDIFQQEIFGPVLCITSFDTEEEAIQLANDTPYGLTNYVYTRSGPRRRRLAWALRSGMVEMNDEPGDFGAPFGGIGASGIGREGGIYGLEDFCHVKSVTGYWDEPEYDMIMDGDVDDSDETT